ncbi:8-amino-7-oxononanoate synthase [Glycomyces artemisiae]|uniref:8-amino-7-oxononanoate synthase n=2 Tax=Glycomyces artemisiae TaxID=1076443 RepID=A0A2T0UW73_9ACTN|nr:aminotransferase class I/II-fold pyridoxal phosphate-dependent enzyme [Glycomyces artemisiae]PRY62156.1 8-amino-7-oxononanoate synthase [Glycomyces artemisiae]
MSAAHGEPARPEIRTQPQAGPSPEALAAAEERRARPGGAPTPPPGVPAQPQRAPDPMNAVWDRLARKADLRAKAGLARTAAPRTDAIDLAGNDYLGLSRHPDVLAAAAAALAEHGLGASGSRLVRGTTGVHEAFEADFARHTGAATAVLYSSGYLANLGAVAALASGPVLLDAHAHASLHDAARLAGRRAETFAHNDLDDLERRLRDLKPALVAVESVYSVLGDAAPLADLHALTSAHGALLLVDEAHAIGTIGPHGAGGVAAAGLAGQPGIVLTATLSKALGAAGGVVAGPAVLRRHLHDTGRTFIYDTAPPPAVIAGAAAALRIARESDGARTELARRAALAAKLLDAPAPAAGVCSPPAGDARAATAWAARCAAQGVAVGCFRPPSTPDHRSRLRITVNTGVPAAEFAHALDTVLEARP